MDLLQNIDPAHLPYVAVGCALLCIVVFIIGFVLQAVSGIFEIVFGLFELVVDLLQGGPVAWCGCFVFLAAIVAFVGVILLFLNAPESCAEHPTRFCQWFGFLS
ncbi:MAG: hypothetical protein OXG78_00930 [Chloroflexi bacterium]|nr:hypothetical protein [Chloroflexota bacterium]